MQCGAQHTLLVNLCVLDVGAAILDQLMLALQNEAVEPYTIFLCFPRHMKHVVVLWDDEFLAVYVGVSLEVLSDLALQCMNPLHALQPLRR